MQRDLKLGWVQILIYDSVPPEKQSSVDLSHTVRVLRDRCNHTAHRNQYSVPQLKMSELLVDIRNMELDEIDPADLAPIISSKGVSFVPVPAEDKDGNERVEDEDEDKNEDEDEAPPGLETDESSSVGDKGSAIGEMQQIQVELRPGDHEDHNSWEPPNDLQPLEY